MNKQTMTAIRKPAQAGFTLIELIVVIVILGILAATALPKFANLGGDARGATLNAAKAALSTTTAMIHGQYLINPAGSPFNVEGTSVIATTATFGYPEGDAATAAAAGITNTDYTITANATAAVIPATATVPAIPANGFIVVPNSIHNTATALTCFVSYARATGLNNPPAIGITITTC